MLDPILVNKLMGKHRSGMNGVKQAGGLLRAVEERSKFWRSQSGYGDPGLNSLQNEIDAEEEKHVENPRESYTHTSTLFSSSFKSFILSIWLVKFDLNSSIVFTLIHQ